MVTCNQIIILVADRSFLIMGATLNCLTDDEEEDDNWYKNAENRPHQLNMRII